MMTAMTRRRAATGLLLLCATAGDSVGQPMQAGQGSTPFPTVPPPVEDESARSGMISRMEKARNEDRQKRLVSDTDKLLALATQLHEDVAKTDKNMLSIDVIRRAEEIERLAHAVKERMRG